MLIDCLKQLGKGISSVDRTELEKSFKEHQGKGLSEYDASMAALGDFHKGLFDDINELRRSVRLQSAEYKPFSKAPKAAPPVTPPPEVVTPEAAPPTSQVQPPGQVPTAEGAEGVPAERTTSIKNAAMEAAREAHELPGLTPADYRSWEEAGRLAHEQGLHTPDKADAMAEAVLKKGERLTDIQQAGLRDRIRDIENQFDELAKQTDNATPEQLAKIKDEGNLLRDKFTRLSDAAKKAGTGTGRDLAMRKSAVDQDMLLTQLGAERSYKVATGKEPTPDVLKEIKDLREENDQLRADLTKHNAKLTTDRLVAEQKKIVAEQKIQVRQRGVRRSSEDLKAERADLKSQIAKLSGFKSVGQFITDQSGEFDPTKAAEISRVIGKLARNYIEDGLTKAEDITKAIHDYLKDATDLTHREVEELLTNYGRTRESTPDPLDKKLNEVKSIVASSLGKADVLEKMIRPKRRGSTPDKPTEDQRRALREMQDVVRENTAKLGEQPYDVKTEQATPLDKAIQTAKSRGEQLRKQLAEGKKEVRGRQQVAPNEELLRIKAENEGLEKAVALMEDPAADQKAIDQRLKVLNELISKTGTAVQTGAVEARGPREGAKSLWTPEIGAAEAERRILQQMRLDTQREAARRGREAEAAKPTGLYGVTKTWADFEKEARKTLSQHAQIEKRIAEYDRRIKAQDFETKARQPSVINDRRGNELRAKLEQVKRNFEALKEKNKPATLADLVTRWKRFSVLGYPTTFGKLAGAATGRMTMTPLYNLVGEGARQVPGLRGVFKTEPHATLKGEWKAVSQLWQSDSFKDILSHLKGGDDLVSLLYGEKGGDEFVKGAQGKTFIPRSGGELLDRPGHLHAAIKVIPKRAAFFREFENRLKQAETDGKDVHDPAIQMAIAAESYPEAQRAILQQRNPVTTTFNNWASMALKSKYRIARGIGRVMKYEFPITNVPVNFAGETALHIGGLPAGIGEVAVRGLSKRVLRPILEGDSKPVAFQKLAERLPAALDELPPEQRARIARAIKTGTVGAGFVLWGMMRPDQFGGYYQPGKRDEKDVKFGGMRFAGIDIPRWLGHIPPLEAAQFGATLRRVYDEMAKKGERGKSTQPAVEAVKAGVRGMGEEMPFIDPLLNPAHGAFALVGKPGETQKYLGGELKANIPGAIQQAAKIPDYRPGTSILDRLNPFGTAQPIERKPTSVAEEVKMAIPGLRGQVPIKTAPLYSGQTEPSAVTDELNRVGYAPKGAVIRPDESLRDFQKREIIENRLITRTIESALRSATYRHMSDADKLEYLKSVRKAAAENAQKQLEERYPALEDKRKEKAERAKDKREANPLPEIP